MARRPTHTLAVNELFNSSEKRLARTLLLLARWGGVGRISPDAAESVTGNDGRDGGDYASRVNFFMNKFRKLGFIEYNGGLKVNNFLLSVVLHD